MFDPKTKVREILKSNKASIMKAPLPSGSPGWADIQEMLWEEIQAGAKQNVPGYRTIRKLLTDKDYDK